MSNIVSGFRIFNPGAAPLIASLCRICQVQQTIDQMVQWRETARLSPGQTAEAMIINILCGRRPLWKMEQFFDEIDLSLLYGVGITSDHLNDDVLGRCLDKLAEIDLDKLVSQIGLQALLAHNLSLRVLHIDTTSISVEGEYANQAADDFLINYGHSKDRRSDLKQFKLGLACQEQGMIVGGQLLNGNASDKVWNPQMIDDMHQFFQSNGADGTIFVIDSAGVSKDTIADWQHKKLKVISRFPETFNLAEEVKSQALAANSWNSIGQIAAGKDGSLYKSKSYQVEVEGTPVRLIVVYSSALALLKQKTLQKKLEKSLLNLEKEAKKLSKLSFACEPDANEALAAFLRTQKDSHYQLTGHSEHIEEQKHAKRGRPKADEVPNLLSSYQIQVEIGGVIQDKYEQLLQLESTFVLVTTLSEADYPDEAVLREYKEQNSVESRFRFVKQPAYLGAVYLKNPRRVKALGYIFVLALMVGSYLEHRVRSAMEQEKESLILPGKKKVSRPSLNTIMEFFDKLKTARFRTDTGFTRQWPENLDPQVIKLIKWAGFDLDIYLSGLGQI